MSVQPVEAWRGLTVEDSRLRYQANFYHRWSLCFQPDGLQVVGHTGNSAAHLPWDPGPDEKTWQVLYRPGSRMSRAGISVDETRISDQVILNRVSRHLSVGAWPFSVLLDGRLKDW